MAEGQTAEIVARHWTSGSVVVLSALTSDDRSIDLQGFLRAQPGPSEASEQIDTQVTLQLDDEPFTIERRENAVVFHDQTGQVNALTAYASTEALGGRYSIHSGAVHDEGESAVVFAITDPIELVLAVLAGAGCLAMYGGKVWAMKQTFDSYKALGLAPKIRIRSSFLKFITCKFDVSIEPYDPKTGSALQPVVIHIGRA
jgi:hypothetical protein